MHQAGVPSKPLLAARRVQRKIRASNVARLVATLRTRLAGHKPRSWLLISDGKAYTSEQQFAPLLRHRQAIASRLGITFRFEDIDIADTLGDADLEGTEVVGLKLAFTTPLERVDTLVRKVAELAHKTNTTFIAFDGDDDLCVLWPKLIDAADAYVKKHRFARDADYARAYVGKSNLTDYVHRSYGVSFADNIIPNSEPLDETATKKIVLGWNIAQDDKIVDLSKDICAAARTAPRDIDVLCRASVNSTAWIHDMRDAAVKAIAAMGERYSILAPTDRVPQGEYYREILRARVTVSPFGYGELCWRDFETILCGSLLAKPDMSHAQTWPDIFVPHETYIPVSWDFGNLEEVCAPYLADEEKRTRAAEAARTRLLESLRSDVFLDQFAAVVKRINATGA